MELRKGFGKNGLKLVRKEFNWNRMVKRIEKFSDIMNFKKEDIILAAHPKVGSTWLRFLFCNIISLKEWDGRVVDFNLLNKTLFSFGSGRLKEKWKHDIPRIVKTHQKYYPFFPNNRIILMLRDPRDVMISYYHYLKVQKKPSYHFKDVKTKDSYEDTFTNFITHPKCGFDSFFQHYNSWKDKTNIVIKYEDLKKEPINEFAKLLNAIGITMDDETVEEAVRRSDIKNVRKMDNKNGHKRHARSFKKNVKFTRDGSIEQWRDYFNEKQLEIYHQYKEKYNFKHY